MSQACPLCDAEGGVPVWRGAQLRLIRAEEAGFPVFYRVVWNDHLAEFSDLSEADRHQCMEAVATVERQLRAQLAPDLSPDKINLAALGNLVPHLHWHVIARYTWDSHFPAPVWAVALRPQETERLAALQARLPALDAALAGALRLALG